VIAVAAAIAASLAVGVAVERRWGRHAQRAARGVLTAVLYGLLPLVTFFILARFDVTLDVGAGIVLAWVALALTGGAAWLVSRRVMALSRPETGSVVLASIHANTGYLGLPLTVALLGREHLAEALVYDVLVGGPALWIAGFAVGAAFGDKAGEGIAQRARAFLLRNPILAAVIAAMLVPDALAPDFLVEASRTAVLAILPLGFFAAGVLLAEEAEEGALPIPPPVDGAIATAVGLRLLLTPALLAGLAAPLVDLPPAYLLLAAMPCGINALAVAHVYGLTLRTAAAAISWGTVLVVAAAVAAVALR
jgi:malonate transporter